MSSGKRIPGIQALAVGLLTGFISCGALGAPPDAVAGKAKAQACFACHGESGIAAIAGVPHLAAQPPQAIQYQLVQFREKYRSGGGMEVMAAGLSDQDMRDIAAYYTALPAPVRRDADAQKITHGQRVSQASFCQSCHGASLQGQKHVPRIAGQAPEYVVTQLRNLRSGTRVDMDGNMASAAKGLSDEDIEALAAFSGAMQQ
ncbi:MAG: c-type cytochrome [Herminiimonas sp.]|nr:c-type cytochrome [Herminiimonas sp.]